MSLETLSSDEIHAELLEGYPEMLDIRQMAAALGICERTCYRLLRQNRLHYLRIGRMYRIPKTSLMTYLKSYT